MDASHWRRAIRELDYYTEDQFDQLSTNMGMFIRNNFNQDWNIQIEKSDHLSLRDLNHDNAKEKNRLGESINIGLHASPNKQTGSPKDLEQ